MKRSDRLLREWKARPLPRPAARILPVPVARVDAEVCADIAGRPGGPAPARSLGLSGVPGLRASPYALFGEVRAARRHRSGDPRSPGATATSGPGFWACSGAPGDQTRPAHPEGLLTPQGHPDAADRVGGRCSAGPARPLPPHRRAGAEAVIERAYRMVPWPGAAGPTFVGSPPILRVWTLRVAVPVLVFPCRLKRP